MEKPFNSKYNIGQSVAETINIELGVARGLVESGLFNKAFVKYMGIMSLMPIKKIDKKALKTFKALDKLYAKAQKEKKLKLQYRIIIKYREILIGELDTNGMYLPSLKDYTSYV